MTLVSAVFPIPLSVDRPKAVEQKETKKTRLIDH